MSRIKVPVEKKIIRMSIALTREEAALIRSEAEKRNVKISRVVRDCIKVLNDKNQ